MQDKPLRLCYVIATLGPGGAERQVAALSCGMARRGHDVYVLVISCEGTDGHYLPLLKQEGVKVHTISRTDAIAGIWLCWLRLLRREVCRFCLPAFQKQVFGAAYRMHVMRPHVVHTYLDSSNLLFSISALMADVPRVRLSLRSLAPNTNFKYRLMDSLPIMRAQYRGILSCDRVSIEANSRAGAREYAQWLGIDAGRIAYVPNGISQEFFPQSDDSAVRAFRQDLSLEDGAPIIACILRMKEEKCPLSVLEVAKRVCAQHTNAHFIVIGEGDMYKKFLQSIDSLGLKKQVLLLGRRSDIPTMLKASCALLLTSRVEGMPNAIMEGMFFGLPIVATNVGGIPDLVTHGEHGYLYAPNDIDGLAEGLCRLLYDPSLAQRMGSAGAEKMRKDFALTRLVDNMESVYRDLLT